MVYGDDDSFAPCGLFADGSKILWNVDVAGGKTLTSKATLSVGASSHVVGTYDGASLTLYVNGALDDSLAAAGNIANYSYCPVGLTIGDDRHRVDNSFNGVVGEAAVYTHALSASDVSVP